jgi:hypothetical protein
MFELIVSHPSINRSIFSKILFPSLEEAEEEQDSLISKGLEVELSQF